MAINMVTDPGYGYALVSLCGVSPVIIPKAMALGVQLVYSASGVLSIKNSDGSKTFGVIPLKGSTITLLKEGKLGPASKESLKYQVEKCLNEAIGDDTVPVSLGEGAGDAPLNVLSDPSKQGIEDDKDSLSFFDAVVPKLTDEPVAATAQAAPSSFLDTSTMAVAPAYGSGGSKLTKVHFAALATKDKVALVDATELGQPVASTSVGSTYYLAAIFIGLKLAIRYQGETLSIRVEGAVAQYKNALQSFGFSVKPGYASIHVSATDKDMLKKVFGATIGALGFSTLLEVADPDMVGGA